MSARKVEAKFVGWAELPNALKPDASMTISAGRCKEESAIETVELFIEWKTDKRRSFQVLLKEAPAVELACQLMEALLDESHARTFRKHLETRVLSSGQEPR
jgi:hypothetical protein